MQLYIYILSHPLLKQLSGIIQNKHLAYHLRTKTIQQLGFFLIYETIRKWLSIQELYVRHIDVIKQISFINPKESYCIITSTSKNYGLVYEVDSLLPKCEIIFINWYRQDNNKESEAYQKFNYIPESVNKDKKIIILEKYINSLSIVELVNYLTKSRKIKISQIRLTCIACHINILEKLSKEHPGLKLYIVQIVHNY